MNIRFNVSSKQNNNAVFIEMFSVKLQITKHNAYHACHFTLHETITTTKFNSSVCYNQKFSRLHTIRTIHIATKLFDSLTHSSW